ncbi:hypothetical protein HCN44_010987 [Aphidius gifuensis]|uniref:Uncharacterized protein n=1 Tax=Aphidius gifuensis TaxID=684658 RepID=A0A835CVZ5_APHGI|nr:hypothetical protein HCN44_010987 [Aphidius gifuensis]
MEIHNPRSTVAVKLYFRGENIYIGDNKPTKLRRNCRILDSLLLFIISDMTICKSTRRVSFSIQKRWELLNACCSKSHGVSKLVKDRYQDHIL